MGVSVKRFYDVGVSGIHRLLSNIHDIRKGKVSIVIAGMEGALASVVGGLVNHPICSTNEYRLWSKLEWGYHPIINDK